MKQFFHTLPRLSACLLIAGLSTLISSCGYRVGSLMHPQIKTIAIADIKNESSEPLGSALLRNILAERFQFDNSLKLTSLSKADCILYARIMGITNSSVTWRSTDNEQTYRPNEFSISVAVEFTVLIPGQAKPLVERHILSSSATYLFTNDPAIGRQNGLKQAFLRVSDSIVRATTEAW
ncbi:MAG: LPS assembly lipoprotein LptE [Lentisphaeria bacterium]|nr:LPS assembly lipoprotein LptE [Lentisphaeria bacterium]